MQKIYAFTVGGVIAILGGLIGLGGAEFRLPVLVRVFKYRTAQAIIINLVISLVTVIFSFVFRAGFVNLATIIANSAIILTILAGSLMGACVGVNWATRIDDHALTRVIVVFLFMLSFVLIGHEFIAELSSLAIPVFWQTVVGFVAGIAIGIFSSMLGVAGGELIIPTIVLVFAQDIKLVGSLSLAISMPTIIMGLAKYQQHHKLREVQTQGEVIVWMAVGSIFGALVGSFGLQFVSSPSLYIVLGLVLFISAIRLTRHQKPGVELG